MPILRKKKSLKSVTSVSTLRKLILKLVRETMVRTEINETINRKTVENETETWFFELFNKIGGRGRGKLGRSERVAWTYIHYQM